jgi:hypothetical protein
LRELSVEPAGFGVGVTVQLVPSQCSASVERELPLTAWPTATQSLADVQSTAESVLRLAPSTFGVDGTVQAAEADGAAMAAASVTTPKAPVARFHCAPRRFIGAGEPFPRACSAELAAKEWIRCPRFA